MKIHLVTNLFAPDSLGGAALYTDLARYLRDAGHDIRVTTTFSYYPRLHYLPEDRGQALREEHFEGIPVRRVAMRLPKKHRGWRRFIPELSFQRALRRHGAFPKWLPDVLVAPCPMMAHALAAPSLYGRRVPLLLIVQDLMADAASKLGIVSLPGLKQLLYAVERRALARASSLVTISRAMEHRLRALHRPSVSLQVVPNWIHGELAETISRLDASSIRRADGTLFYSGNVGVKQGLPDFLDDFDGAISSWRVRIHGDGAEAETLRIACRDRADVEFGPLLPEEPYVQALLQTTACLITQRAGSGDSFLPSKLLPALATGTPVLAVCDAHSPLGEEVTTHGFGTVLPPGDRESLAATLKRWRAEPGELITYSMAAKKRAAYFTRDRILGLYTDELTRLTLHSP